MVSLNIYDNQSDLSQIDWQVGGFFLVDKPLTWSSFHLVKKLRYHISRKLGIKKYKIGHAGTLDPLATGLMLIAFGKHTKQIEGFASLGKCYSGTITLGATTPSFDLETEPENHQNTGHLTSADITKTAAAMVGEQLQTPPIFSAKKVDGKRAYKSARQGQEVKMRQSLITINEFDITSIELPQVRFNIICSKGTYIRSIANDFGDSLKIGGHLSKLCRESVGDYQLKDAFSLNDLVDKLEQLSA